MTTANDSDLSVGRGWLPSALTMRAPNGFVRMPRIARLAALALLISAGIAALVYGAARWTDAGVRHAAEVELADRVQAGAPRVETALDAARTKALIVATNPAVGRLLVQGDRRGLERQLPADVRVTSSLDLERALLDVVNRLTDVLVEMG